MPVPLFCQVRPSSPPLKSAPQQVLLFVGKTIRFLPQTAWQTLSKFDYPRKMLAISV